MCGSKCIERGCGPRPGQYPVRIRSSSPLMITMGRGQGGRATRKGVMEVEQNLRRTRTTVCPSPSPSPPPRTRPTRSSGGSPAARGAPPTLFQRSGSERVPRHLWAPLNVFGFLTFSLGPLQVPRPEQAPVIPPPPTLKLTFEMASSF